MNIHISFKYIHRRELTDLYHNFRRRQWQPTPVLLPGQSHGGRSLVGCGPWGCEESDTTERLCFHFSLSRIGKEMATHSTVLAWRTTGTVEMVGCHLWSHTELNTTEAT